MSESYPTQDQACQAAKHKARYGHKTQVFWGDSEVWFVDRANNPEALEAVLQSLKNGCKAFMWGGRSLTLHSLNVPLADVLLGNVRNGYQCSDI